MKPSSSPKVPFHNRVMVLSDTVMSDSPRKMHDRIIMASGRPSGWMRRALGSTVVAIMERVIKMAKIVRHADAKQQKLHKVLSGGGEYILRKVKQHTHRHRRTTPSLLLNRSRRDWGAVDTSERGCRLTREPRLHEVLQVGWMAIVPLLFFFSLHTSSSPPWTLLAVHVRFTFDREDLPHMYQKRNPSCPRVLHPRFWLPAVMRKGKIKRRARA